MKDHIFSEAALLFMKAPRPGKVKTRIAESIGDKKAAELYRNFILDMLVMLKKTEKKVIIFYYPNNAKNEIEKGFGRNYICFAQKGGGLGERMKNAFDTAFGMGIKKAVLMGTDIPDLPYEIILKAFQAFDTNKAVIGPCFDGGYYLIGFKQKYFCPSVFQNIPWSTGKVFKKTCYAMKNKKIKPYILPKWRDMDNIDDLFYLMQNKEALKRAFETISYLKLLEPEKQQKIIHTPGTR